MQIITKIVVTIVLAALTVSHSRAQESSYCLVVHRDSGITEIRGSDVARIFLGKKTLWTSGKRIQPVMLNLQDDAVEQFVHDVLKQSSAQFRTYWRKRLFSGGGTPPRVLDSQGEALAYVRKYPYAIGIVRRVGDTRGLCLRVTD